MHRFLAFVRLLFLLLVCISCAEAQGAPSSPLRTLIVSGGPTIDYNQYAIESNARYVEKLTAGGKSQRVLFADGKRNSRTIPTYESVADKKEATVLAWLLDEDWPATKSVLRAPTLKHLDGAATPANILTETRNLASSVQNGERGLFYFTGHGSPNTQNRWMPDYENTIYSAWWNSSVSVQELAPALQSWPQNAPLTLVMVQCHSGGFANLIFQGGDPKNPIWPRDFCGFFASLGELVASGCTSEVDEQDYQDFTTHFFAALSGITRDGRVIALNQADFDKNGVVSGLEALAYADLHDDSIDVPLCTSDVYLRSLWPGDDKSWVQTPFSTVNLHAEPWQSAVLTGLSRELHLSGEARLGNAFAAYQKLNSPFAKSKAASGESAYDSPVISTQYYALESAVLRRFPNLKSKKSRSYEASKRKAIAYLKTRPTEVAKLYAAETASFGGSETIEIRAAKLWRFVRMARTVILQERVKSQGTSEQKAVLARLRTRESRNFLK